MPRHSLGIDHLVIAAKTLEQGIDYLLEKLSVENPAGGEHLTMGTHNLIMSLGNGHYLEVIAIAPHLENPKWPRWFCLDD
ncbi:MAG: VOC family protein [Rhodospirillales bacterium]|nr:VOC family protein [Rhodospirillales bacterium]